MLKLEDSNKLLGKFKDVHVSTLALNTANETIEVNKSFCSHFFNNLSSNKEEFLEKFVKRIMIEKQVQSNGCCFNIDRFTENGIDFFLFCKNNNNTSQSFLWLKHDLLNILNPIMGFSDVLLESETIEPDELELIEKIHQNSKKMYNQIDRLAILQNLGNKSHNFNAEEYKVGDFFYEMADILWVNKFIDYPSKVTVEPNANVTASISNHNLRNILEGQIVFMLSFQDKKNVDFNILLRNDRVIIQIEFGKSQLPTNYLEEMQSIEKFSNQCNEIKTIQTTGLNYLLLSQVISTLNGEIYIQDNKDNNKYYLELSFPVKNRINEDITKDIVEYDDLKTNQFKTINAKNIPDNLFKKLHKICHRFDGLIILDKWEELANKVEKANSVNQNKDIKKIVEDIRVAIRLFDIEKLKKIHVDCKMIFHEAR